MKYRKPGALPTPVLEVGGTHVTAALVVASPAEVSDSVGPPAGDHSAAPAGGIGPVTTWRVLAGSVVRRHLDAHGSGDELLDVLAEAANALGNAHNGKWGVALPGPFDYRNGIARYEHVGKFDHLQGVDVRAGLAERLKPGPKHIAFLNDADAFGIGEFAVGVAGAYRRATCITLGTGVGSTFLADAVPVKSGPDVPPDGSCYLLTYRGRPLEEAVSRRAIRREYAAIGELRAERSGIAEFKDTEIPDVREIAELSRGGDTGATRVLENAFAALGEAAGPYVLRFGTEVLIVGGSMAGSWDIVEPAIRKGLTTAAPELAMLPISKAERSEEAGLIGAAVWTHRVAASGVALATGPLGR
jgi:glucokinase